MQVNCIVEERISKKTNRPYYVIVIRITDSYKKIVFLNKSEYELIKTINCLD